MQGSRSLLSTQLIRTAVSTVRESFYSTVSLIEESNLVKLEAIQKDISGGKLLQDGSYSKMVTGQITSMLCGGLLNTDKGLQATARLLEAFARSGPASTHSHEEFLDFISKMLLKNDNESVLRGLLPSFLMACKSLRYYDPLLMSHAGKYIIDNLENFDPKELNTIVHAYAKLNHHLPHLISDVERLILSKHPRNVSSHLLWSLAWCGMVFAEYPKEILTYILTDDHIEGNFLTQYHKQATCPV